MLSEIKYGKHIEGEVIDFTMHECGGCGIPFFVPTKWLNGKKNDNGSFHCPNGCSRIFTGKTEAQKLKDELDRLAREKRQKEEELQNRFLDEMNKNKKLTHQLKRLHKGVCPCCNRSFVNLQQHMKKQHPDKMIK